MAPENFWYMLKICILKTTKIYYRMWIMSTKSIVSFERVMWSPTLWILLQIQDYRKLRTGSGNLALLLSLPSWIGVVMSLVGAGRQEYIKFIYWVERVNDWKGLSKGFNKYIISTLPRFMRCVWFLGKRTHIGWDIIKFELNFGGQFFIAC